MKTVFVSGSSRGIGKAIAASFAAQNYKVLLNCRKSAQELALTQKEFLEKGYDVEIYLQDLSSYTGAKALFETILEKYGSIDVIVNNAAIAHYGLFTDTTLNDWENIFQSNVYTVFNCTHSVIPAMVSRKKGVILNISSIWGQQGASCEAVYAASKGAVDTFTKSMAKELGPSGITVNAVSLGAFDTEMMAGFTPEEKEDFTSQIALGALGSPQDVGPLCVYLANQPYITGQIIVMDGGYSF